MEYLINLGKNAKKSVSSLSKLSTEKTNEILNYVAEDLCLNSDYIISQNQLDVALAKEKGTKDSLIDRLTLTEDRIKAMGEGLKQVSLLKSPLYETVYSHQKENGLIIEEKRVPFGVIGIIFESRPNVVADAFALCFKTHNAVILRGGSDAINSNKAIVKIISNTLTKHGVDKFAIQLIEDTSREVATEFMKLNSYIDLLIPRGGAGLISSVIKNATVPVIETGTGNCHIFVDESANLDMAVEVIFNAKTQRYGVCNACESLVIHKNVIEKALPLIKAKLDEKSVKIYGDEYAKKVCPDIYLATEEDFYTEYLDAIISVKTINDINEAIEHINAHNTGHSESIITENVDNANLFMKEVDAAAVYHNASTRFTDGFEYGLGAEIGISTQKLHARGPMGLNALTTRKFYCFGNGQIRK